MNDLVLTFSACKRTDMRKRRLRNLLLAAPICAVLLFGCSSLGPSGFGSEASVFPANWDEFLEFGEWEEGAAPKTWDDWEPLMQQMPPLEPGCGGVLLVFGPHRSGDAVYLPREYFEQPSGKRIRDPNWKLGQARANSG